MIDESMTLEELLLLYPNSKFSNQIKTMFQKQEKDSHLKTKRLSIGITSQEMADCLGMSEYEYLFHENSAEHYVNEILNLLSIFNGKTFGYIMYNQMTNDYYNIDINNKTWSIHNVMPVIVYKNYSFIKEFVDTKYNNPDTKIIKVEVLKLSTLYNLDDIYNERLMTCDYIKYIDTM